MMNSWKNFQSCDVEFECNIFANILELHVKRYTCQIQKNSQRQKE